MNPELDFEALQIVHELAEQNALVQREVEQDIDLSPEYERQKEAVKSVGEYISSCLRIERIAAYNSIHPKAE